MKSQALTAGSACLLGIAFGACCLGAPVPEAGVPKAVGALAGHADDLRSLLFSPDGKILASAGRNDGTARLWDVGNRKCIRILKGHTLNIWKNGICIDGVAFSPDGKTVATCGDDMTIRLWDVDSGKNTTTFRSNIQVRQVAFSPDGKTLVSHDPSLWLWDLRSKKRRAPLEGLTERLLAVAFAPSGKLLVVTGDKPNYPNFSLWDVATGKKSVIFKGHTRPVMHAAFTQDGKTVASCSYDQTVRLWDRATGKNTAIFKGHPGQDCLLAFSPDGKILASSYVDDIGRRRPGAVRLFAVPSGKILATLKGYTDTVCALTFSPNGRMLATSSDSTIKLWSLPSMWKPAK